LENLMLVPVFIRQNLNVWQGIYIAGKQYIINESKIQ